MANQKNTYILPFKRTTKLLILTIISLMLISIAIADENFYEILGLTRDAQEGDIKKAFRKLSLKYHPDKNPGDEEASHIYKKINRAYEILSDSDKRQIYDQQGLDGLERFERGGDNRQKGPNAKADINVSLEDLYVGAEREMSISRNVYCPKCRGTGAKGGKTKTCPKCHGQGVVMQKIQMGIGMQMQMQAACDRCQGRGQINAENCPHCRGKKVVQDTKTLEITVEKGMADGDEIVFEREAEQVPDMIPGDVIFSIKQQPHPKFKRVGDNLFVDLRISLEEALLGYTKRISHLDNHLIEVSSKPGEVVQPFSWKIIQGEGMPKRNMYSEFGDLHIKQVVEFPKTLTEQQKELIKKILPK